MDENIRWCVKYIWNYGLGKNYVRTMNGKFGISFLLSGLKIRLSDQWSQSPKKTKETACIPSNAPKWIHFLEEWIQPLSQWDATIFLIFKNERKYCVLIGLELYPFTSKVYPFWAFTGIWTKQPMASLFTKGGTSRRGLRIDLTYSQITYFLPRKCKDKLHLRADLAHHLEEVCSQPVRGRRAAETHRCAVGVQ